MEFSELALPAEEASSAGRALSPAPSALSPACELSLVMMMKMMTDLSHQKQDHCIGSQIRQVAQLAMPQSLSEEQGSKGTRGFNRIQKMDKAQGAKCVKGFKRKINGLLLPAHNCEI